MGKGKPSEIWKEIKPRIGDMVTAANDMEQSFDKAVREAYENGYLDAAHNYHEMCDFLDDEKKEAYQRGLNDAWEAARKISHMSMAERNEVFGNFKMVGVTDNFSASEVIEKIRQYEQEKEEIQVGDEVYAPFGKAIVVNIDSVAKKIWLVYADGHGGFEYFKDAPNKTGRHFPEIAEVLAKMKERE